MFIYIYMFSTRTIWQVVGGQYGRAVLHSHGGDIIISISFGRAFKKKPKVKCLREPT